MNELDPHHGAVLAFSYFVPFDVDDDEAQFYVWLDGERERPFSQVCEDVGLMCWSVLASSFEQRVALTRPEAALIAYAAGFYEATSKVLSQLEPMRSPSTA